MKPILMSVLFGLSLNCCSQNFENQTPKPPLGWNSYDCYGTDINEQELKACVDVLAERLLPLGYNYVVIDAHWYKFDLFDPTEDLSVKEPDSVQLDKYGRLVPALNKFPSSANGKGFKPMADYVHSKGMKFGIHIMRGISRHAVKANTPIFGTEYHAQNIVNKNSVCPWNIDFYGIDVTKPGAQEYYNSLFNLYASWGVDFVKADDMLSPPYHKGEIEMVHKAIMQCGRPIVLSLSPGEAPPSFANHLMANANMWRISGDFWDRWGDMDRMFDLVNTWSPFIGKNGTWPDADMLPIGNLNVGKHHPTKWFKSEHLTKFTHDEIVTKLLAINIYNQIIPYSISNI